MVGPYEGPPCKEVPNGGAIANIECFARLHEVALLVVVAAGGL